MGYSRKLPNRRRVEDICTFLKNPPGICHFTFIKNISCHPCKFCKTVWHRLVDSEVKNQDLLEFHMSFREHPWKLHFFFNWPLEFPHVLSLISLENLYVLNPLPPSTLSVTCLGFFCKRPCSYKSWTVTLSKWPVLSFLYLP